MEIRNVIELSAFSKSLSKKITYLNHEERILKEEKGRVIKKTVIDNSTVGRRLTDEEFVNMYPSQCNIFKEIFKEEFQVAYQKIYEKLKNKK
jgi:hypothetical protein